MHLCIHLVGEMHVESSIGHFIKPFFIFSFTSQTLTPKRMIFQKNSIVKKIQMTLGQCHLNFFHNWVFLKNHSLKALKMVPFGLTTQQSASTNNIILCMYTELKFWPKALIDAPFSSLFLFAQNIEWVTSHNTKFWIQSFWQYHNLGSISSLYFSLLCFLFTISFLHNEFFHLFALGIFLKFVSCWIYIVKLELISWVKFGVS